MSASFVAYRTWGFPSASQIAWHLKATRPLGSGDTLFRNLHPMLSESFLFTG